MVRSSGSGQGMFIGKQILPIAAVLPGCDEPLRAA